MKARYATLLFTLFSGALAAEPMTIEAAIEKAYQSDHRIGEKRYAIEGAQALVAEAEGADDVSVTLLSALAVTTDVSGGLFEDGQDASNDSLRDDAYDVDGIVPWLQIQAALIKPLYTFGKIENYKKAAEGNVEVKKGDLAIQRSETAMDVVKAYYGWLAARDGRLLLEDAKEKLDGALEIAEDLLEDDDAEVSPGDVYALKSGIGLIEKFIAQTSGLEKTAQHGLSLLTDSPVDSLAIADKRLRALPFPEESLEELQDIALKKRPEMTQLVYGRYALSALVAARKNEKLPNVFAGIAGSFSWAPGRDRLDNPHIYDPFNHAAASPLIGLQWQWDTGRQPAKVAQAQAQLNQVLEKGHFAAKGIPFQVKESYFKAEGLRDGAQALKRSSREARRWMTSAFLDFQAGIGEPAKLIEALKTYVLAYSDYLITLNDYNYEIMNLKKVTGQLQ